jgi:glycerol-3-phosphate dehydrogenase
VEAVRRLEDADASSLLHLSKGVHICLRAERLPISHMVIANTQDRRSVFVIPHGRVVYVGTTDNTYRPGYEVWPEISLEDVEYLLEPLERYFRVDPISPDEVVAAWAGLRPLIAEPGKPPQEISRREEILVGTAGVVTMAGGKLTGYRPMAVETLEKAAQHCNLTLAPAPAEEPPLPGGDFEGDLASLEAALVREAGVTQDCAARLVRLYGSESSEVVRGGTEPLLPGAPVLASEIDWSVRMEGAATVEDVVYRRLRTPWVAAETREPAVAPIAERMASLLGWDEARKRSEAARTRELLTAELAFREG